MAHEKLLDWLLLRVPVLASLQFSVAGVALQVSAAISREYYAVAVQDDDDEYYPTVQYFLMQSDW